MDSNYNNRGDSRPKDSMTADMRAAYQNGTNRASGRTQGARPASRSEEKMVSQSGTGPALQPGVRPTSRPEARPQGARPAQQLGRASSGDELDELLNDFGDEMSSDNNEKDERVVKKSRKSGNSNGGKRKKKKLTPGRIVLRVLLVIVTFVVVTFAGAYMTLWTICHGPSVAARDLFVSTMLETGQMQFIVSWFFSEDEILEITDRNALSEITDEVDVNMINTQSNTATDGDATQVTDDFDIDGVEIVEISGRSFYAKMMIVNDPSRVRLSTIYPWATSSSDKNGQTLEELVQSGDYLGGVNGGEYVSDNNWGGQPKGLVVCDGEIQYNSPQYGDVMIGFNEQDILVVTDIGNMTSDQVASFVEENQIRDAVSFKDVDDGDSNHFTKLIINGTPREISGNGSGANPRTAIGQRADGSVLLLVTDGRGSGGHLGATAQDLIAVMQEYGAVNAANLDGGSSSAMYYDGAYEMTSVTLYYSTSSWRLPTSFVVERRDGE